MTQQIDPGVKTVVHLMRHGEVFNPEGVLYGRLPDFHLSDLGRKMAERGAEFFAERDVTYVVASPLEIARIRRECGKNLLLVVPGVRPQGCTWDDQKRVLTPEEAMRSGADYLVVGKPIRDAKDPRQATRQIVSEMEQGLASPSGRTVHLFRGGTAR